MNGAECLAHSLVNSGVEVCFMNPGTSEMHLVAAMDLVAGMTPVLGLFEGVVTGAADGYARMTGRPAATLLHLGPGLANGLANLHNARRAASPIVNIVGDHATYHAHLGAPLTSDIVGFARPVSGWIHTCQTGADVGSDAARAVQASRSRSGQVATLILPADVAWSPAGMVAAVLDIPEALAVDDAAVEQAAKDLRSAGSSALLLRGHALQAMGLALAGRIGHSAA